MAGLTSEDTPAPFWNRLTAMIIDISVWIGLLGVSSYFVVILASIGALDALRGPAFPYRLLPYLAIGASLYTAAYRWRRTPGMVALNLRLIDARSGGHPEFWQALVRAVPVSIGSVIGLAMGGALLISGAPHGQGIMRTELFWYPAAALAVYLLTYLPMAVTTRRQSTWDILSRTCVLSVPPLLAQPPSPAPLPPPPEPQPEASA